MNSFKKEVQIFLNLFEPNNNEHLQKKRVFSKWFDFLTNTTLILLVDIC